MYKQFRKKEIIEKSKIPEFMSDDKSDEEDDANENIIDEIFRDVKKDEMR